MCMIEQMGLKRLKGSFPFQSLSSSPASDASTACQSINYSLKGVSLGPILSYNCVLI